MKLVKAIETMRLHINHPYIQQLPELQTAMWLGIEALKRFKSNRKWSHVEDYTLLPGETQD